ncbi:MAG: hypothetical protein WAT70_02165 [Rhizobiaceae bacterium]
MDTLAADQIDRFADRALALIGAANMALALAFIASLAMLAR